MLFCTNSILLSDYFFYFWRTEVLFVGPLIPLFWTFGDIFSRFQSQSGKPYSHLAEVYVFPKIHLWCDTCQPLDGQHGRRSLPHMHVSAEDARFDRETSRLAVRRANHSATKNFQNLVCTNCWLVRVS